MVILEPEMEMSPVMLAAMLLAALQWPFSGCCAGARDAGERESQYEETHSDTH